MASVPTTSKQDSSKQSTNSQQDAGTRNPLSIEERMKVLDAVGKQLNTQFKTVNSLVRLGSKLGIKMPHYATQIPSLDHGVLGVGGVPRGRVIEVFGPESAGKTTLTLILLAADQALGNLCAFVDAEHALDPNYAKSLGVDVENLFVSQPDSGEQALETVEALIDSRAVTTIVIDSVAALVPQAELDGEMGDSHMGLQARLMSQAMRKLSGKADKYGVTLIFINQIREKIGVMFGSPETTTGGRALKFYASVRLDVRRVGSAEGKIMSGINQIGHVMKIKGVKNKVGSPFRETLVDVIYGVGIDRFADTVRYAKTLGVIEGTSWLSYKGERLAQGMAQTIELLRDNPKVYEAVKAGIAEAIAHNDAVDGMRTA